MSLPQKKMFSSLVISNCLLYTKVYIMNTCEIYLKSKNESNQMLQSAHYTGRNNEA